MGLKFSNTIGAPFRSFVSDQLTVRALKATQDVRTLEDVLYLANKNAWVRVQSSVQIESNYYDLLKSFYEKRELGGSDYTAVLPNQGATGTEAARNWVLQSGTSKIAANGTDVSLRYGLGPDGEYGLGGTYDMGYRPMPGLDSVTVETAGSQGSLRYATINFKVWNMTQLDIIDALYFRLGFTMLLEWGHVEYFTNDQKLQRDVTGITSFYKDNVTKEEIQLEINQKVRESNGNYDGMLGVVCNFNYSMNQDGGWDCSIKLVGLGTLLDTQRINSNYSMPKDLAKNFKELQKAYNAEMLKEIKKLWRENNRLARQAAQGAYNSQVAEYNRTHPINDVKSFFDQATYNAATKTGRVLDYNSNTDITDLSSFTILTPVTPTAISTTVVTNLSGGKGPAKKYFVKNNGVRVNDTIAETGFTTSNNIYLPWIVGTANYSGEKAGWKYPLQVGSTYKIRSDINDWLTQYTVSEFRGLGQGGYNNIQGFGYQYPNVRKLTLGAILKGDSSGNGTGTEFDPNDRNLINVKAFVTYLANKQSLKVLRPGIEIYYGPARTLKISQETGLWEIKVYLTDKVSISTANLKDTDVFIKPYDLLNKIATVVDQNVTPTNSNGRTFEILDTGTLEDFSADAKYINGSDVGKNPKYLKDLTLVKAVTINNVPYYENANTATPKGSTDITFTLGIKTDIAYLLQELVKPATGGAVPTYSAPTTGGSVDLPKNEGYEDDGLRNCTSALEAILTLIQYTAVVNTIKTAPKGGPLKQLPTDKLTAQVIESLPAAPLQRLFESGSLKAASKIDQDIVAGQAVLKTDPYYTGLKGYNTALLSDQIYNSVAKPKDNSDYDKVPTVNFEKLMQSYVLPRTYKNTEQGLGITTEIRPVYIPFGYLLFFMNNICMLFDSTKPSSTNNKAARPFFYIDFNPETNFCLTTPYQLSTNPEICLIPFSGTNQDYYSIFKLNGVDPTDPKSKKSFSKSKGVLFDIQGSKDVSPVLKTSHPFIDGTDVDGRYRGRTMDIQLNTQYLLNTLRELVDRDGSSDVYFRPFINKILGDINKALGGINAFRLAYVDESNTAAIVDDQYIPPRKDEINILKVSAFQEYEKQTQTRKGTAIIPIFDQMSNIRTLEFQTNISTRMSSIIAIGARDTTQSNGSAQATDGSPFYWLSRGLKDRIIREAQDVSKVVSNNFTGPLQLNQVRDGEVPVTPPKITQNNETIADNFNYYIQSYYGHTGDNQIDRAGAAPMTNYYIQATTKKKAIDPLTSGAPVIPVNVSFTTDGISGVNMGNLFLIPEKNLPISLRSADGVTPTFGYMVMGLNHQIQSNQWVTNIRGQIIRMRPNEVYQNVSTTTSTSGANPNQSNAPGSGNGGNNGNGGSTGGGSSSTAADLDQLKQELTPQLISYLQHQQGPQGLKAILYYTFKDPKDVIPSGPKFVGKKGNDAVINGNMADNFNTKDYKKYVDANFTKITPEVFLRYQVFKWKEQTKDVNDPKEGVYKRAKQYETMWKPIAAKFNVDLQTVKTAAAVESRINPKSQDYKKNGDPTDFHGMFQLTYDELRDYGEKGKKNDIFDAYQNSYAGIHILSKRLKNAQDIIDEYVN